MTLNSVTKPFSKTFDGPRGEKSWAVTHPIVVPVISVVSVIPLIHQWTAKGASGIKKQQKNTSKSVKTNSLTAVIVL